MSSYIFVALLIGTAVALPSHRQDTYLNSLSRIPVKAGYNLPRIPDGFIVGGQETEPHEYPWQVGLFMDFGAFCGGSVIDKEWILTAAHCVANAESIEVVMGAHYILEDEPTQIRQTSTDFTPHENYSPFAKRNDVAVIKLPTPLIFNEYIQKIELSRSEPAMDTLVSLTGWGVYDDKLGVISDMLREVEVEVMSDEQCSKILGPSFRYEELICLKGVGDKGSCSGDSGGPLNFDEQQNGVYVTGGICAFGLRFGCENAFPKVYTSTFYHRQWIFDNTGIAQNDYHKN